MQHHYQPIHGTYHTTMAKSKRSTKDTSKGGTTSKKQSKLADSNQPTSEPYTRYIRLYPLDWTTATEYALNLTSLLLVALVLGFAMGAGWINVTSEEWRLQVAQGIRLTTTYQLITLQPGKWQQVSAQSWRDVT